MKHLLVQDWMTAETLIVDPKTRMLDAHRLMREKGVRRLPVVKKGKVVGIITRSDVREAQPSDATSLNVWEMNYLLAQLLVRDIMTKDVYTVRPEDTVKTAATILYEKKIGALPVIDKNGKLAGIITESDIFRVLISWFNEDAAEIA